MKQEGSRARDYRTHFPYFTILPKLGTICLKLRVGKQTAQTSVLLIESAWPRRLVISLQSNPDWTRHSALKASMFFITKKEVEWTIHEVPLEFMLMFSWFCHLRWNCTMRIIYWEQHQRITCLEWSQCKFEIVSHLSDQSEVWRTVTMHWKASQGHCYYNKDHFVGPL